MNKTSITIFVLITLAGALTFGFIIRNRDHRTLSRVAPSMRMEVQKPTSKTASSSPGNRFQELIGENISTVTFERGLADSCSSSIIGYIGLSSEALLQLYFANPNGELNCMQEEIAEADINRGTVYQECKWRPLENKCVTALARIKGLIIRRASKGQIISALPTSVLGWNFFTSIFDSNRDLQRSEATLALINEISKREPAIDLSAYKEFVLFTTKDSSVPFRAQLDQLIADRSRVNPYEGERLKILAAVQNDQKEEAKALIHKLYADYPENPQAAFWKAVALNTAEGDRDVVIAQVREAIRLDPQNTDFADELKKLENRQKRWEPTFWKVKVPQLELPKISGEFL